jgi:pentatricopeptide repeat protein
LTFRTTEHVLVAARKLVMASTAPDDPLPEFRNDRRQSLKRSSSSSSNSAHRFTSNAVQKSKALTARIGELGWQGRWQDVLRALETAESSGQKLNAFNYCAAIAALVRCKQPERALQLLPLMQQRGIELNVVTYNSFIDACSKSGQWQRALELLNDMQQQQGVAPNAISYNSAINACSKDGQWQQAERLLHKMQQRGV